MKSIEVNTLFDFRYLAGESSWFSIPTPPPSGDRGIDHLSLLPATHIEDERVLPDFSHGHHDTVPWIVNSPHVRNDHGIIPDPRTVNYIGVSSIPVESPSSSYLRIQDIPLDDGTVLRRKMILTLDVVITESGDLYQAEIDGLDYTVAAVDLAGLKEATEDLITLYWYEYAQEDDENLAQKAMKIKETMLRDFMVVK